VICAPFLIISHDVFKNAIHFVDDVHLHHFLELDFSRLNDGTNNLHRKCIELWIINFKVLEKNLNKLQFVEDYDESWISLNDHGEQLQAK